MISFDGIVKNASSHGKTELEKIKYLDGWRGLAIGFVLVAHFIQIPGIDLGTLGVDIFFVLSGLLMSRILFIKRVPLKIFYKRRISRVFPVFVIFLSLIYLLSYVFGLSSEYKNYFYSLFFMRSYFPATPDLWHTGIPIGHIWSLNVEEHCYILLSLITLLRVFRGREFIPLLGLGVGAIVLHYLYIKFPSFASQNYQIKTEIVASHILLSAGYYLVKANFDRFVMSWMPVGTFILAICCYSNLAPWYSAWLFSPFLLAFTVNHLDRIPDFFKTILSNKQLQLLGVWSYSIYLWQQPFYYYGVKFGSGFSMFGLILLIPVMFVALLSFYYVENPLRKYLNNHW